MKQLIKILILTVFVSTLVCGCTTTQKTATYKSLSATATLVDGARKAYSEMIVLGKITHDQQVPVDSIIAKYQVAMTQAIVAARFDYTQPTPTQVSDLAETIVLTIETLVQRIE